MLEEMAERLIVAIVSRLIASTIWAAIEKGMKKAPKNPTHKQEPEA